MAVKPLNDRILVERLDPQGRTAGGIVLPDTAREKPKEGKVVAVGEGKLLDSGKRIPLSVKKGDTVVFGAYAGTEVKIDGNEYVILREEDVLGIVEATSKGKGKKTRAAGA